MKKILLFISVFFLLTINVNAAPSKKECQDALVNSGYAYYYRGKALQYDSKVMTFQGANHRQQRHGGAYKSEISSYVFYPPEAATTQDYHYTVCSGFTGQVLYEAFKNSKGEVFVLRGSDNSFLRFTLQLVTLGESEKDKDIVVYYNDKLATYKKNKDTKSMEKVYKKIIDTLEPGDIIVRTTKTGGHALMYVGNDKTLESGGDSSNKESDDDENWAKYDFKQKSDNVEPNGTVKERKLKRYTNWKDFSYTTHYDGYNGPRELIGKSVQKIIIIRVANRVSKSNDWNISSNAKNRSSYPKLSFTKTSNRSKYQSIALDDSITYTISLTNHFNKDYKNVIVTDQVPANTSLESMTTNYSGKNNNGSLSWTVTVPAKKTVKITFKVRVVKNTSLYGTYIVSDKTKVNNIKLNTIKTLLVRHLPSETKDKISKLKSGDKYDSTAALLNYLYKDFTFVEPNKLLEKLFSFGKDDKKNKTYILKNKNSLSDADKKYMNMYVPGLFGGYYTYTAANPKYNDERSLTFDKNSFIVGDILLLVDSKYKSDGKTFGISQEVNAYVYLGDNQFATVNNKKVSIIDKTKGAKLIDSLLGQNCFIVLRPMKAYVKQETTPPEPSTPTTPETPTTPTEPSTPTPTPTPEPSNPEPTTPTPEPTPSNPEDPGPYPVEEPSAPREESEILKFIKEYAISFIIVILILGIFIYITISSNIRCKVKK